MAKKESAEKAVRDIRRRTRSCRQSMPPGGTQGQLNRAVASRCNGLLGGERSGGSHQRFAQAAERAVRVPNEGHFNACRPTHARALPGYQTRGIRRKRTRAAYSA